MKAWEKFLERQEKSLGKKIVDQWLRPLQVLRYDACNLYLNASDPFHAEWFEEHIRKVVEQELFNNNNKRIKVHLLVNHLEPHGPVKKKSISKNEEPAIELKMDELDPSMTFDSFISTQNNLLPLKLLTKISNYDTVSKKIIPVEKELPGFNPIYLYGAEGTGKTHLLHATAHALKDQGLRVRYVRSSTFTEHVVNSIRAQQMPEFREIYRNIDVLIIDKVEHFARKNATQEELFHTFNTLHLEGKQIILSGNCPPLELKQIEPRLVSRFEWGIVLPLEPLDEESLHDLLIRKTKLAGITLPSKTESFLVSSFHGNTSSIVRAIEAISLRSHMQSKKPSASATLNVPQVKELLKDLLKEEERSSIKPEEIVEAVAEYFEMETDDIFSKAQARAVSFPRHIAMYLCKDKLKMPYTHIGRFFSRDHSTIMTNIAQIQKLLNECDPEVENVIHSVTKKINQRILV